MNLLRRKFLRTASFVGAAVTVGSAVLVPQRAIAAYNEAAFQAKDVDGAMMPHAISMGSGGQTLNQITVDSMLFNFEIDAADFEMPVKEEGK